VPPPLAAQPSPENDEGLTLVDEDLDDGCRFATAVVPACRSVAKLAVRITVDAVAFFGQGAVVHFFHVT
jgi:hypothetical protein